MSLPLRLLVWLVLTVALWAALILAWGFAAVMLFPHGAITECDRGGCGALGEFTWDTWPLVPLMLGFAAAGIAYAAVLRRR